MEKVAYLIKYKNTDDWEAGCDNFGIVFTKGKAESLVSKLNIQENIAEKIVDTINDAVHNQRFYDNIPTWSHLDIPKWRSGISMDEITIEMREERNRYKQINEKISTRNQRIMDKTEEQEKGFKKSLLEEYSLDRDIKKIVERDLFARCFSSAGKREYTIEKIEVLK